MAIYPKKKKSFFSIRNIWRLRYRVYAILIMVVLLPILYGSSGDAPSEVRALGYNEVNGNWLATQLVKAPIVIPKDDPDTPQVIQVIDKNGQKIYVDKAGQEITDALKKAGYDSGFISSDAFVDLHLPVPVDTTKQLVDVSQAPKDKTLNDIVSKPADPQLTNFLRYPKYNINVPIVYSSLEDLFNKNADGSLNFASPRDTSDVNSPIQQKLKDGVLQMAFTPQPGEIGNSYIVGHSSNYSYIKSPYNSIFKPLERKSQVGEDFYIYDRFGRELHFKVIEVKEIKEEDTSEAYKTEPGKRVVTLQTSILEFVPGKGYLPTKRWLTRGELEQK